MVPRFIKSLKDNSYFKEIKLKDSPETCCTTCDIPVIYFDFVKDEFCKKLAFKGHSLKSVDFLFFPKTNDEVFLIEMKRKSASLGCRDFIEKQLGEGNVIAKAIDSVFIILGITGFHRADAGFFPLFLNKDKTKIKIFLLSDFTDEEFLTESIGCMDILQVKVTKLIENEIRLLSCTEFSKKYA